MVWSIYFITGQKEWYSIQKDQILLTPPNPLKKGTAHKMDSNTTYSMGNLKALIEKLIKTQKMGHVRFFPKATSLAEYDHGNKKFHELAEFHGVKVIDVTTQGLQGLLAFLRHRYEDLTWQHNIDKVKKHCLSIWPSFFDNPKIFADRLNTWHDLRENIAFHIRPHEHPQSLRQVIDRKNVYTCQIKNWLFDPKFEIIKILNFLGFEYTTMMIDRWLSIHDKWSANLKHYIKFCDDIDLILFNIINRNSMSLKEYKMDVLKEAVLLHFLMYKHNLNLKTKIDKFPDNTNDITNLISVNTRTGIEDLYQKT